MSNTKVSGNKFYIEDKETTMFDMYFKENMDGEKILLYNTAIRKKYSYILEENEKFSTEARMHYKIEEKYKVKCYNIEIISGDYLQQGYTKNISNNLCERCFRIRNYNEYKTVIKDNNDFIKILKQIDKTNDLVVLVVDLFNINKNLEQIKEYINNDILLVLTKRDILPKSCYDKKLMEYFDIYK